MCCTAFCTTGRRDRRSVGKILTSDTGLRERIIAFIEAETKKSAPDEVLAELQTRREQVKRRTALIVSTLDEETLADARQELDRLKAERRTLDEQIAAAQSASAMKLVDPTAVADAVLNQLRSMAANINDMPKFPLRQLLTTVIGRVVLDLETRAAEVQMILPLGLNENLFGGGVEGPESMRLVGTSASSTSDETHSRIRISLGRFACPEHRIDEKGAVKRPCYVCCRAA